jgi:hypothetical protein
MSVKMLITHAGYSAGSVVTTLSPARETFYVTNGWALLVTPTGQYLNAAGQFVNHDGTPVGGFAPGRQIFVTMRNQGLGQSTTGLSVATIDRIGSRIIKKMGKRGAKNLRLVHSPHWLSPIYSVAPNNYTVAAGVEQNSIYNGAKWSAATSILVRPTDSLVVSDVVLNYAGPGESLAFRNEWTMTVGQQVPVGYLRYPASNTVETCPQSVGQASQLVGIGVMPIGGSYTHAGYGVGELAVIGEADSDEPSVLIFGNSIADGTTATAANDGLAGWLAKGLGASNVPHCRATRGSNRLMYSTPDIAPNQYALAVYATHNIAQEPTNDIFAGQTLAQIQANALACWAGVKAVNSSIRIYQPLVFPRTTSTDAWATEANQTPIAGFESGGIRDQFNAWVYTKVADGTIHGVINGLSIVESTATHGVWPAGGLTADGVHPTAAVHDLLSAIPAAISVNWTAAI